jgi:hypothetical protein
MPRPALVDYRRQHLVKPVDWYYRKDVVITAAGLAKMQRHFGLEQVSEETPGVLEGVCTKWDWVNRRIIEVAGDDGAKRIVRVRDARMWRPDRKGNRMRVKFFRDGDQWRQTGRSPRYPGVW